MQPQGSRQLETPTPATIPLKTSLLRRILRWKWAAIVFLATVVIPFEGYPWLSVQRGEMLDPRNPFSELFEVSDEGYVPLTNLSATCATPKIDTPQAHVTNVSSGPDDFATYLGHGGVATLPCFHLFRGLLQTPTGTKLEIEVTYAFNHLNLRILRRSQIFRFQSIRGEDGSQHWQFIS